MKLHHIPELLLIPLSPQGLAFLTLGAFAYYFPIPTLIVVVVGQLIQD